MQNVVVVVRNGDVAQALHRLRKKCQTDHVFSDVRRTECCLKPSVKRQLKHLRARKRARKALLA
jgi:ribosomal protein S21